MDILTGIEVDIKQVNNTGNRLFDDFISIVNNVRNSGFICGEIEVDSTLGNADCVVYLNGDKEKYKGRIQFLPYTKEIRYIPYSDKFDVGVQHNPKHILNTIKMDFCNNFYYLINDLKLPIDITDVSLRITKAGDFDVAVVALEVAKTLTKNDTQHSWFKKIENIVK